MIKIFQDNICDKSFLKFMCRQVAEIEYHYAEMFIFKISYMVTLRCPKFVELIKRNLYQVN